MHLINVSLLSNNGDLVRVLSDLQSVFASRLKHVPDFYYWTAL